MEVEVNGDQSIEKGKKNRYVLSGDLLAGRVTTTVAADDSTTVAKSWYHLDHLNSTKVVTDETGSLEVNYTYRAFGEQLRHLDSSGQPVPEDLATYSYSGKELDDTTNLYYFNARYYDASIGRFINVDPIQDGSNWYVYCSNNPLSFIDPTGLTIEDVTTETVQQASTNNLGESDETIAKAGCVLTAYTRIASAISGEKISLDTANEVATELELFSNGNELMIENGAALIAALTGKEIGYGSIEGPEGSIMDGISYLDRRSDSFYVTARIDTYSLSDSTKRYQHTVNVNEGLTSGDYIIGRDRQPVVDTSNRGRTELQNGLFENGSREELLRADYFYVKDN